MLEEMRKTLVYIVLCLAVHSAYAYGNSREAKGLLGSSGTLPRNPNRHILGVIANDKGGLTLVTSEEHKIVNTCVRVLDCNPEGQVLNASEFLIRRLISIRSTTDPCMPVIWISSSSYTAPNELWVAEHNGAEFDAKLLLREGTEDTLWLQKCWLLEVGREKKIFVKKHGSKKVRIKGQLNLLPVYWLYCYVLENGVLKLEGKVAIGEGKTESYEVTVECGVVDDKVQIWACDHLDRSQRSILRAAEWRTDGELEWIECYKAGYTGSLVTIDPLYGSAAAIFEQRRGRPYSSAIICELRGATPKVSNLGYGFGGKHQLLAYSRNEVDWLLLNYEAWNMRILALDNRLQKVKELERRYSNPADLHLVRGRNQSWYALILFANHIRVEELKEYTTRDPTSVKDKKEEDEKLSEKSVLDAYRAYVECVGKDLVNATNSQLAKDITEGNDESSIISYYRLLSRDEKRAKRSLTQRITHIVRKGIGKEHWITEMQLAFYGKPAIKPLLDITRTGVPEEREIAVEVLYLVPDIAVVNELIKLLDRFDVRQESATCVMICEMAITAGKPEVVDFLIKAATGKFMRQGDLNAKELRGESRRMLVDLTKEYDDTPEDWSEQKWSAWWKAHRGIVKPELVTHPELTRSRNKFKHQHVLFQEVAKKLEG